MNRIILDPHCPSVGGTEEDVFMNRSWRKEHLNSCQRCQDHAVRCEQQRKSFAAMMEQIERSYNQNGRLIR